MGTIYKNHETGNKYTYLYILIILTDQLYCILIPVMKRITSAIIILLSILSLVSCIQQINNEDIYQKSLSITKSIDDIPSIYPVPSNPEIDPVAGIYVENSYPPIFNGSLKTQDDYSNVYMALNRDLKSMGWKIEVQSSFINKEFGMAQLVAFREGLWLSVKIYSEYGQTKVTYQSQKRTN